MTKSYEIKVLDISFKTQAANYSEPGKVWQSRRRCEVMQVNNTTLKLTHQTLKAIEVCMRTARTESFFFRFTCLGFVGNMITYYSS